MNQIGIHALVWVGDWTAASARYAVESTRAAGFDLLELPVLNPAGIDVDLTRQLLADNGLASACSLGLRPDADVSSEDPRVVARGQELLYGALEVAIGVGAKHLCGVLYSALGKPAKPLTERGRENAAAAIAGLARQARGDGIQVSLEVVNRYEANLANTAHDMSKFLDACGDGVGLHLDTYHMNIEENDFESPVRDHAERLTYTHVGESHRGHLGSGTIDFERFFAALHQAGYAGPVTFESFSSAVVHPQLSNTLAVWRNLWDDSEELARHAHGFITRGLEKGA